MQMFISQSNNPNKTQLMKQEGVSDAKRGTGQPEWQFSHDYFMSKFQYVNGQTILIQFLTDQLCYTLCCCCRVRRVATANSFGPCDITVLYCHHFCSQSQSMVTAATNTRGRSTKHSQEGSHQGYNMPVLLAIITVVRETPDYNFIRFQRSQIGRINGWLKLEGTPGSQTSMHDIRDCQLHNIKMTTLL